MCQAKRYLLAFVMLAVLLSSSFVACDLLLPYREPMTHPSPDYSPTDESTPTPKDTPEPKPEPNPEPKPELVVKVVILKYDDGTAESYVSSAGGGYLVDFTPPSTPFFLTHVNLYTGAYNYRGKDFDLSVLDGNLQTIYSDSYPQDMLPMNELKWIEFETDEIEINDRFYILVYAASDKSGGMCIGFDNSFPNTHSEIARRFSDGSVNIRTDWPYMVGKLADKSKVNFMIQAGGYNLVP
jgi:hypothetical protein